MFNRRPPQIFVPDEVTDKRLVTSWLQPTNETMKEQEELLSNMFFLVKQGAEFGERLRCRRCNQRHDYITLMCINKPISGLAGGLYAYWSALKEANATTTLKPDQLSRLKEIERVLKLMPDLSKVHPLLARKVTSDLGPNDMSIGAVSLGILEGISPIEARALVEKINNAGIRPAYTLAPVNQNEIDRALEYRGPRKVKGRW